MAAVTKEIVRRDAHTLARLVEEVAEQSQPAELAAIHDALGRALATLRRVVSPPPIGAYETGVDHELRRAYFPQPRSPRRPIGARELREADTRWDAARERGHRHREEALAALGPMLTPGEVAARLGVSTVTVNNWRRGRKLLGLRFDDHQFLYPLFQFAESPAEGERGVLRGFDELLGLLGALPPWQQASFFLAPSPSLGGRSPLDVLRVGDAAGLARVRELAAGAGEMGA